MTAAALAFLFLLLSHPAGAQESQASGSPAPQSSTTAPAAAPAAEPNPEPTPEELVSGTIAQDISTASYYELLAQCQELGLDDSGSRRDLQLRLAQHFGVTLPEQPSAAPTITVRSARVAEYYTLSEANEKYVDLRGDVTIEVRNTKNDTLQTITAARVTYNITRGAVSAEGNVTYALTQAGKTDTFTGQSLSFDLNSSEAVFFDGKTTRTVQRGGKDISFTFTGSTITRMPNDTVVLENGRFTSSETPEDPLYQVHADKVWLLAPGEWAIQSALLMIGRVPILPLPGFFLPGDEFIFNPVPGYKNREGSFIQTTTYLLGRKKQQDNPFSFLQLSETSDSGYTLEPHGFFLRKVPGGTPPKDEGYTLKLMLDAYSRLGALAALGGDFSPLATFRAGIGVSRSIFVDPTLPQFYTPFWLLPDKTSVSYWNASSIFGLAVPFRFGLEGTLNSAKDFYSVNAGFQYFSDPSFTSDFYSRSESGLLASVLPSQTTAPTTTSPQTNLSWDLASRFDFTKMAGLPFVQNLSIPNLSLKFTWQSNTPAGLSDPQASNPGSTYYYPSSITVPNVSLALSGDVLKLSSAPRQEAAPASGGSGSTSTPADPGKGFRAPFPPAPPMPGKATSSAAIAFRGPVPQSDVSNGAPTPVSSLAVSYQVQPRATLEHTFDTAASMSSGQADYGILYRTFETGGTSSVTATASLWDRLAELGGSLSADGLWRERFDPSPSSVSLPLPAWQSLLLRDLQQDRLALRTAFQGTLRPFPAIPALAGTNLQYRLGLRLYQLSYSFADPLNPVLGVTGLTWTPDAVSEHSIQSSMVLNALGITDTLALTAQLPPLTPTLTARMDLTAGILKGRIQGSVSQTAGVAQYQPLLLGATLDFGNSLNAAEDLQIDLGSSLLDRSTSQVNVGDFSAAFVMERMMPVDAKGNVIGGGIETFLPSTVRLGYESGGSSLWFWKDRIKLDLSVKSHWYLNLQKYTDNLFDFALTLNLSIYKTLDLSFSSVSANGKTYRYFPGWPEALGEPLVNPLYDLLWSYDFFYPPDRSRSAFKIRTLSVSAVQHMPDWDLTFQYQGSPQVRADPNDGNRLKNMWTPSFSIQIQWNAVTEVKSSIRGDTTGVYLR